MGICIIGNIMPRGEYNCTVLFNLMKQIPMELLLGKSISWWEKPGLKDCYWRKTR